MQYGSMYAYTFILARFENGENRGSDLAPYPAVSADLKMKPVDNNV